MDKGVPPTLFVNDGSFMERFNNYNRGTRRKRRVLHRRSMDQEKLYWGLTPIPTINKTGEEVKLNVTHKTSQAASSGKTAFSLKQKSKFLAPVKLGGDEDDDDEDKGNDGSVPSDAPTKRQKLGQSSRQRNVGKHHFQIFFLFFLVMTILTNIFQLYFFMRDSILYIFEF